MSHSILYVHYAHIQSLLKIMIHVDDDDNSNNNNNNNDNNNNNNNNNNIKR